MFAGSITLPVVHPCLMSAESSNILVGRLFLTGGQMLMERLGNLKNLWYAKGSFELWENSVMCFLRMKFWCIF